MQQSTINFLHENLPRTLYYFLNELYRLPRHLLRVSFVRFIICYIRKFYFINIKRTIRTFDQHEAAVGQNTISHNLRGISDLAVRRSQNLIYPAVVIDKVIKNAPDMKALTIGPRAEGEIYNLIAHGFSSKNITALDLISYSPYVTLGDMHKIPFPDNSFDIVFAGWVLSYSNDLKKAEDEIIRVAKNGAIIAVGASYDPISNKELQEKNGYLTGADVRFNSIADLLKFFEGSIDKTYFQQDVEDHEKFCDMISVFSIKK